MHSPACKLCHSKLICVDFFVLIEGQGDREKNADREKKIAEKKEKKRERKKAEKKREKKLKQKEKKKLKKRKKGEKKGEKKEGKKERNRMRKIILQHAKRRSQKTLSEQIQKTVSPVLKHLNTRFLALVIAFINKRKV